MKQELNKNRHTTNRESARKLLEVTKKTLEDSKAEGINVIDLEGRADFAYFIVVASGTSSRHISAVAEKVADALQEAGVEEIGIEGKGQSDWVLLDAHDIVVHLFKPEARELYEIEKMWEL